MATKNKIATHPEIDSGQIRTFWKLIVLDGRNHKFQVFKKDRSVSKEIDVNNVEKLVALCKKHNLEGLTCLSVNPFKKGKTKVGGVAEITGILIDIDVKKDRKVDGVSTPDDKAKAKKTAEDAIKKLEEHINLRISLFVDSGNGYHIYIPIYINLEGFFTGENEDENKEIWDNSDIKGRLVSLEDQLDEFNNDIVEIDCISKDIVRRVKIPGTWNVKKEISEKDYRVAQIIESFEDALDIFIDSNTNIFNSFKPVKERPEESIKTEEVSIDFTKLLKRDTKLNDLFTGNWKKEPYSLEADGTPKKKWTRSEAEHMLLCRLIWYDLTREQTFSIMDKSKIGKWKTAPSAYKTHQYKSAMKYINKHGGTKTTSKRISIKNGDRRIATLQILGKNEFSISRNDGKTIFPPTESNKPWQTSIRYRSQIIKALVKNCKIIEPEAEEAVNVLCAKADKKIKQLGKKKSLTRSLDGEKQNILDKITKVSITRSVDNNVYQIHLNGEIIILKDKEFYDGPYRFCVGYFNRFLEKIVISDEEWDQEFIPHLLSEEMIETEETRMESDLDIVYRKFMQFLGNKQIYDWKDIGKRIAFKDHLFLDVETGIVFICRDLIDDFFESHRILVTYKKTVSDFNGFIREEKQMLAKERRSKEIPSGSHIWKSFWQFKAENLHISAEDIAKEETLDEDVTGENALKIEEYDKDVQK